MNKELEKDMQLLRDYIKNHPEVLKEKKEDIYAMSEEERRQMQEEEEYKQRVLAIRIYT